MARLSVFLHPARLLDRVGLDKQANALRRLSRHLRWLSPHLRPNRAVPLTRFWLGEKRGRPRLRVLSEQELRATRRSETAFVFGSGRSLTEISPREWQRIAVFDTVAFSHFHRQDWIRVDYHLVAEVPFLLETAESFRASPRYTDTIYGLMRGWSARAANELVARGLLPNGARIFRWRRIGRDETLPPSVSLSDGLVHGTNSLIDVVNFALLLGWRRIVIAGVDLYNKEYFWLPPGVVRSDEKPKFTAASRWEQADQMLETFALWRRLVECEGIELGVYNPKSLLAQVLPVIGIPDA